MVYSIVWQWFKLLTTGFEEDIRVDITKGPNGL